MAAAMTSCADKNAEFKYLIDEFAEIKLNKVDAEKVKQGSDLFIIDNALNF